MCDRFQMKKAALLALFASLTVVRSVFAQASTVDWTNVHQVIDGFGASLGTFDHALPCDNSSSVMTKAQASIIYGTGNGQAGLTLLRVEVCPDGSYPDNTAIGYVLRANPNVKVWASPWTPPVAYTANGTIWNGSNCLLTRRYAAYAAYLTSWVRHERAVGIPIYLLSVQNEPDYLNRGNQPVCGFSAAQFDAFVAH